MSISEQERELLVQGLMSLQTGCDERYARQILKKHGWNADQAATALLDVASAEEEKKNGAGSQHHDGVQDWLTTGALNSSGHPMPVQRANSVIDLTGDDDDDTAKAIVASMEPQPVFGPSNRVDDAQQWAVVPSNAPPALSQEDHALNRALEASLSSSFVGAAQEPYEEPSDLIDRVRKDGWPTALRTTNSALCYAPIVLQCLLSLPSLRTRLLRYNVNCEGSEDQHGFAQRVQRLAAILMHTARAYVTIDEILEALVPLPSGSQDVLSSATLQYYTTMAYNLEQIPRPLDDPLSYTPLLSFEGTGIDAGTSDSSYSSGSYIEVIASPASGNDLMSCLAESFTKSEVCLTQLSECFVFLVRRQDIPTSAGVEKLPFKYPSRLYLDRFMRDNLERATELRNCQEEVEHEAQRLATDRHKLMNWKNADTLGDLRSSMRYFDSVAVDGDDGKRREAHERSKFKLSEIIKQIEAKVQHLGTLHQQLTADAQGMFDNPELQKCGYDLCATIIHDGLFGRSHEYSYTKDEKGRWWKILDHQISETSSFDPVLERSSRPQWPRITRDLVRQDNYTFMAQLPPEIVETVKQSADTETWLLNDEGLGDSVSVGSDEDTQQSYLDAEGANSTFLPSRRSSLSHEL